MTEKDFSEWIDSIDFVDKDGGVLKPELVDDPDEDPEGDRE